MTNALANAPVVGTGTLAITPQELDRDPWLLNVQNGTLDLRTLEVRPHNVADLITRIAPAPYEPEAPRDLWTDFLTKIRAA